MDSSYEDSTVFFYEVGLVIAYKNPVAPVNRVKKFVNKEVDEINFYVDAALPRHQYYSSPASSSHMQKTTFRRQDIFDQFIPKQNRLRLQEARMMRNQVSVIQSLVNFKLSLYTKEFSISKAKPGSKKVIAFSNKWKIKNIQKHLMDDLISCDNCILVWKTSGPRSKTIQFIITVRPEDSRVVEINGKEFLYITLDRMYYENLEQVLREGEEKHDKQLVDEAKKVPKEWFEAAKSGKEIPLRKSEGYHYIVKRKFAEKRENGLCSPSMMAIKTDALILRYLELAEFTTAFNLKNLILHVQQGESVIENGIVNRKLYTSKKKLKALRRHLNNLEKSIRLYTDHTVKLTYIFPPIELFKKERYESVHYRVINIWGGLPNALFAGDTKTSIGSAFISLKRPNIEGKDNRDIISDLLIEFFSEVLSIEKEKVPAINYDNDALRDERLKLDIQKFLRQYGYMDFETATRDFGYDPDEIEAGLKADNKRKDILVPVFEPSQGITAEVKHGIKKGGKGKEGPEGEKGAPSKGARGPVDKEKITGKTARSDR